MFAGKTSYTDLMLIKCKMNTKTTKILTVFDSYQADKQIFKYEFSIKRHEMTLHIGVYRKSIHICVYFVYKDLIIYCI